MILAHLSDLHVSRFGQRLGDPSQRQPRAARGQWELVEAHHGWRIEVRRASRNRFRLRDALRLVDDVGAIHAEEKVKRETTEAAVLERLLRLREARQSTRATRLAETFPTAAEAAERLSTDPTNTNLRFCVLAHVLREHAPDRILISGDLTDEGDGYELIEAGLRPFIDDGRLLCVPGNHDVYPGPPLWTDGRLRASESDKRRRWGAFATRLGLPTGGSFLHPLGEGITAICLDSAHPPALPGSASGEVPQRDMDHIAGGLVERGRSGLRVACLHHHVINLPPNGLGLAPFQPGMRLRNARQVFDWLVSLGVDVVLHGHRHIGYRFQPAEGPLFIGAPSSTLGCRSGASPFYWRLDLSPDGVRGAERVTVEALRL